MTPSQKYLQPHNVFGEKPFDEYCLKIPEFYFKKEVPEDVIKNFEVVEKLLALSYYEYKFIDEAYAKAIHTFEMAMNIRLKDFQPLSKNLPFKPLIAKLNKLNLFETELKSLERLEKIRNYYAHPERHSFAGIALWGQIEQISYLINEMYEEISLRLERYELSKKFINQISSSDLANHLVMEIQNESTILFRLRLLFVNNKRTPATYLFACTPLFDLKVNEVGGITIPFTFKSKLVYPVLEENVLTGTSSLAQEKVTFSSINKHPKLLPIFEEWSSQYSKMKNKTSFESSMVFYISKIITDEIQEFQKM